MTGSQLVMVNRWYPSSKTCSNCGKLHDMPLSVRVFSCDCGYTADRDLNAAINLAKYAAGSAVSACGEEGSGGVSAP
jgi:putative transposase